MRRPCGCGCGEPIGSKRPYTRDGVRAWPRYRKGHRARVNPTTSPKQKAAARATIIAYNARERVDPTPLLDLLVARYGNLSHAARCLGMDRNNFYKWKVNRRARRWAVAKVFERMRSPRLTPRARREPLRNSGTPLPDPAPVRTEVIAWLQRHTLDAGVSREEATRVLSTRAQVSTRMVDRLLQGARVSVEAADRLCLAMGLLLDEEVLAS